MNTSKSSKQNEQQSSIPIPFTIEQPLQSEESAAQRQRKQRMLPPSTSYSNTFGCLFHDVTSSPQQSPMSTPWHLHSS
eukprot:scaffold196785_cov61-Cyclotella_meneghiniana.AAC.2